MVCLYLDWKPPWACSFVFITSSGQVTMPDAKPAPAPHMGLIHAFGIDVECICNLATRVLLGGLVGIVLWFVEVDGSSVEIAY